MAISKLASIAFRDTINPHDSTGAFEIPHPHVVPAGGGFNHTSPTYAVNASMSTPSDHAAHRTRGVRAANTANTPTASSMLGTPMTAGRTQTAANTSCERKARSNIERSCSLLTPDNSTQAATPKKKTPAHSRAQPPRVTARPPVSCGTTPQAR